MKQFWAKKFADTYRLYRIFTLLALFFLFGIFLASFFDLRFDRSWLIFILVFLCLIFSMFVNFLLRNYFLVLLSLSFTVFFLGLHTYSYFEFRHTAVLLFNSAVEITGRIVARPQVDYKSQKLIVEYYLADQHKNSRVLVSAPRFPNYKYDDIIHVSGTLTEPPVLSDFNYHDYLKRYLVYGLINQPKDLTYLGHDDNLSGKLLGSLYEFSARFEASLNRVLSEPHASLAAGILLGVKRNIPDDLMTALNVTGLTHIIALSGYNVTIIVFVFSAFMVSRLGRKRIFFYGTALILFFVLMTGASSSVVRAAVFSFLILFGELIGRQADKTNLMLLAAVLMVAVNPYVLRYDSGFQLSFLAFTGLIYLSPQIKKIFEHKNLKKIPEKIKEPLIETLGAQTAVFPLIWFQFGRLSIIAPLANILVLPLIPLSMAVIFITGILAMVYPPLGQLGGDIAWPVLEYIIKIVELLAKVPWAAIGR